MADEPHIAVLMFTAHRYVEGRVMRRVAEAGYTDLTFAQGRIAARIGPDGTRLTDLADQALVAKQTVTALVDRLEAAGYVERVVDPIDARARLVRIAPRGEQVIAIARAEEDRITQEWTARLGVRRMRELRESLNRLQEITDPRT